MNDELERVGEKIEALILSQCQLMDHVAMMTRRLNAVTDALEAMGAWREVDEGDYWKHGKHGGEDD